MREWLNEDGNSVYVGIYETENNLEKLREHEDWLLDGEGEHASLNEVQ